MALSISCNRQQIWLFGLLNKMLEKAMIVAYFLLKSISNKKFSDFGVVAIITFNNLNILAFDIKWMICIAYLYLYMF